MFFSTLCSLPELGPVADEMAALEEQARKVAQEAEKDQPKTKSVMFVK